MDSAALPFVSLDAAGIRELHGILPVEYDVVYPSLEARGNYIGNSVQIGLKKQLGRNRRSALDLELLFALPLDVLIEILGQLHPIDLYNLMCTNTILRNFLLDKRVSMAIWRYAFRHYPIILHYPPDVSPPQWATLLFGPATCDFCPRKTAMPDFAYRRRLCKECLPNLCRTREALRGMTLLQQFPGQEDALFSMVKYTYRTDGMSYGKDKQRTDDWRPAPPPEPLYFVEEAQHRADEMLRYLVNINAGVAGAEAEYAAYKAKLSSETTRRLKHAKFCHDWCSAMTISASSSVYWKQMYAFIGRARKRLSRLGYGERDARVDIIHEFCKEYFWNVRHLRLSKKGLDAFFPSLENHISQARARRLEAEERIRNRVEVEFVPRPEDVIDLTQFF